MLSQNVDKPVILGPPLVSIGPHTDAIFDRFKLGDKTLPKLHTLITTIWSSRWEENLRSSKWNLNYEETSKLNFALHADLQLSSLVGFRVSTGFIFDSFCDN
jgi:hypothetical protein